MKLHVIIGHLGDDQAKLLLADGFVDATEVVQVVQYEVYLEYWKKVTNFRKYVTHPDWEVQTFGYSGDFYSTELGKPDEHVLIPPQQQLSPVSVRSTLHC